MLPSEPMFIPLGPLPATRPVEYLAMACVVGSNVAIAGAVRLLSANQIFPSGPTASLPRLVPAPVGNSVIARVVGSIVPIACVAPLSMNQRLPSVPTAIDGPGRLPAFRPALNSVIAWVVGLIIPIAFVAVGCSVNQRLPSGPVVIPCCGLAPALRPLEYSLIACVVGLIVPTAPVVPRSVNQRFPSGPSAIPAGMLPAFRPALNSVIACVFGLIIPIAGVVPPSVNHMLPSGPWAIENGWLPGLRPAVNLVMTPAVVIWPIAPARSENQRLPSEPARTWAMFEPGAANWVIAPSGAAPAIAAHDATASRPKTMTRVKRMTRLLLTPVDECSVDLVDLGLHRRRLDRRRY